MYTKHGHHIPGTPDDNPNRKYVKCGGIVLCPDCSKEVEEQKEA